MGVPPQNNSSPRPSTSNEPSQNLQDQETEEATVDNSQHSLPPPALIPAEIEPHAESTEDVDESLPGLDVLLFLLVLGVIALGVELAYAHFTKQTALMFHSYHIIFNLILFVNLIFTLHNNWHVEGRKNFWHKKLQLRLLVMGTFGTIISLIAVYYTIFRYTKPPIIENDFGVAYATIPSVLFNLSTIGVLIVYEPTTYFDINMMNLRVTFQLCIYLALNLLTALACIMSAKVPTIHGCSSDRVITVVNLATLFYCSTHLAKEVMDNYTINDIVYRYLNLS